MSRAGPANPDKQNTLAMTDARRPDPTHGLFETLLVVAGEPIELDAHIDRLAAGLVALFGLAPPLSLADEVREQARGTGLGRLRVTIVPTAAGPAAELATEDVDPADFFPGWERGARLRSLPYPGGLGVHKWADRRPLGESRGATVPLLFDRGDEVLEAGRANLFAAVRETLFTPMADGRILPGVARAGAIAAAQAEGIEVREEPLSREALLAADEVFLTGSVRGIEPARALDGAPLPAGTELSRLVGDRLRQRWLGLAAGSVPPALAAAPPARRPAD
jgi:para-aminobenzoate synthetase/4-amino-4-deoxychorismate lyase